MDDIDQLKSELASARQEVNRLIKKTDYLRKYNTIALLHPSMRGPVTALENTLHGDYARKETRTQFHIFETWRSPMRQNHLYDQRPQVTKAPAWTSAHQYGLAVDFVPMRVGMWTWAEDEDWSWLDMRARQHGLTTPILWDRAHVQSPLWPKVRAVLEA